MAQVLCGLSFIAFIAYGASAPTARADTSATWTSMSTAWSQQYENQKQEYATACGASPGCYTIGMEEFAESAGNRFGQAMGYVMGPDLKSIGQECGGKGAKFVSNLVVCWKNGFIARYGRVDEAARGLSTGSLTPDAAYRLLPSMIKQIVDARCRNAIDMDSCRKDAIQSVDENFLSARALFTNANHDLIQAAHISGFCDSALKTHGSPKCTPDSVKKRWTDARKSSFQGSLDGNGQSNGALWVQKLRDPDSDGPTFGRPAVKPVVSVSEEKAEDQLGASNNPGKIPQNGAPGGSVSGSAGGDSNGNSGSHHGGTQAANSSSANHSRSSSSGGDGKAGGRDPDGVSSGHAHGSDDWLPGTNQETPLKKCQQVLDRLGKSTDQTAAVCQILSETGLMESQSTLFKSLAGLDAQGVADLMRAYAVKRLLEAYRHNTGMNLSGADLSSLAGSCSKRPELLSQISAMNATPVDRRAYNASTTPEYQKKLQGAADLAKFFGEDAENVCHSAACAVPQLIPDPQGHAGPDGPAGMVLNPAYDSAKRQCDIDQRKCGDDQEMVSSVFKQYPLLAWGSDFDPKKPLEDPQNIRSATMIAEQPDPTKVQGAQYKIDAILRVRRAAIGLQLKNSIAEFCTMKDNELAAFKEVAGPVATALQNAGWPPVATCLSDEGAAAAEAKESAKSGVKNTGIMLGCLVGTVATEGALGPLCAGVMIGTAYDEMNDAEQGFGTANGNFVSGAKIYTREQVKAARSKYDEAVSNFQMNLAFAAAEGLSAGKYVFKGAKSVVEFMDEIKLARRLSNPEELEKMAADIAKLGAEKNPAAAEALAAKIDAEASNVIGAKNGGANAPLPGGAEPRMPANAGGNPVAPASDVDARFAQKFNGFKLETSNPVAVVGRDGKPLEVRTVRVLDPSGNTVGGMEYSVGSDGTFKIRDMTVPSDMQGKGVSRSLLERALADHPEVQRISTSLIDDNLDAYKRAIAAGKSQLEAIEATPAFKIRKTFGFTKIDHFEVSPDGDSIDLVMSR